MTKTLDRRSFFHSVNALAGAGCGSSLIGMSAATPAARPAESLPDPKRVLLWENTRKEIRESLARGRLKAAILPTGSVEQHNEHMALVADVAISTLISQRVALRLYPQVLVAPPSPCGYAPYHMARKGTITLRRETFQAYVFDVLESLKGHGFHTVLVLNGHGGNHQPLHEKLATWRQELGINLNADSYWNGIPKETRDQTIESGKGVSHAGEFETSIYLAAFPDRVRDFTLHEYDRADLDYESDFSPEIRAFLARDRRSSSKGLKGENERDRARQTEALLATAEKGNTLIDAATSFFAAKLERMIAESATA